MELLGPNANATNRSFPNSASPSVAPLFRWRVDARSDPHGRDARAPAGWYDRILAQHQAALTLLQARLPTPGVPNLRWLDLACGRGQIIISLHENLSLDARGRIEFWAYDVDQHFARETHTPAALALAASAPILPRTVEELLAAKSQKGTP